MIIIAILLLPLIAAVLVALPLKKGWAAGVTAVSSLGVLVLAVHAAFLVIAGNSATADLHGPLAQRLNVDGLSALILLLIAFVATTAAIYSVGYMGHKELSPWKFRLYHINYNLFILSMLAIPVVAEPTLVWIAVGMTTLASALLVSFENTAEALEAAWKYVILSLMGAAMALFGFLLLFAAKEACGSAAVYSWSGLLSAAPAMPPVLLHTAFLLILIGLGTKVGLVPMHTWLPDAHSQAPSPVCALLSGIETSSILYVILRLFPVVTACGHWHADVWFIVLGLISVGTAAFLLLQVRDYKRMFAFSTVEHMGIILTAVGFGAGYGAMQQIVSHCVTKSFCFFTAGAILLAFGTREIDSVRALIRKSPRLSAALILGGLAIAGAPPFAVFLSEFSILKAGLEQKHYVATGLLAVFIVIAFSGIMLFINRMVFGAGDMGPKKDQTFHLPFTCRLALVLAAIPVVVLGFYVPKPLNDLLTLAASGLGH